MPPRLKRMFAMFVLVVFLLFYIVIAMDVGNVIVLSKPKLVQIIYFAVAGLLWVIPAGAIIWWAYRPPTRP